MKTKQITLENIKNKEELKDYIIDNVRDDINYAIKNGEYVEPTNETINITIAEIISIMCIHIVNCKKLIKILEEEANFDMFENGTCSYKGYRDAARFALTELVIQEINVPVTFAINENGLV